MDTRHTLHVRAAEVCYKDHRSLLPNPVLKHPSSGSSCSPVMPHVDDVPSELRILVCAHIYAAGLPPLYPSLDPTYVLPAGAPTSQPTSYPPSTWTEPVTRTTLASLSLVSKAWCSAARPWLWRKIEVRLPRSWLALADEVVGDLNVSDPEDAARHIDSTVQEAAEAVVQHKDGCRDENAARQIKEAILESMASGPDITIPIELLSPPASREPSRDRPRQVRQSSRSPARWTLMRSITNALQSLLIGNEGGMYGMPDCLLFFSFLCSRLFSRSA